MNSSRRHTSAAPMEAQSIRIDCPAAGDRRKVSVSEFGAQPVEGFCNGEAFRKAIEYCRQEDISELVVPRGIYRFLSGEHPVFDGLRDFRFDGGGSELIFSTAAAFVTIRHCERAVFENFTVDWDWDQQPLASIGRIRQVAKDGLSFELELPEYEGVPKRFDIRTLNPMNPRTLTPGCEGGKEFSGEPLGPATVVARNALRIELPNAADYRFLKPGQTYIVRHYVYDANGFELQGNRHLRMADITIYSAPGHAFVVSGEQRNWTLDGCRVVKRPGTTRCISATADGCHISNSQGHFVIENCDFSYNGDDCLNIHDNSVQGFERIGVAKLRLSRVFKWRNPFDEGDPIEFRRADLSPTGIVARIVEAQWDERGEGCTIEFEAPLPDDLVGNEILFNRKYDSGRYVVRRNFFHQNRARGVLLHAGDGWVENNHFYLNQGSAIQIECGAESRWAEGFGAENVTIRGNLIESCDVNHWNMAVIYMGVYLEQGRTRYPVFRNICIEDNTIVNCPQQAIFLSSCNRVFIRNNAIMNSNAGPRKTAEDGDGNCVSNRELYLGSLMVSHAEDVTIENNRRLTIVPATEDGICVDPETTDNVLVRNNTGFGDRSGVDERTKESG